MRTKKTTIINIFEKSILYILIALLLAIVFGTFITINIRDNSIFNNFSKYILLFTIALFILSLFHVVSQKLDKITKRKIYIFEIFCFALLIIGQLIMITSFNINQTSDAYMVNDQARAIAEGIESSIDTKGNYFGMYSNNNFTVILLILFYKILNKFGLLMMSNIMLAVLDIVCIDIAIFFIWKIGKILKGEAFAAKVLFISILNPFSYMLVWWSYTLVYSLPLITAILYFALYMEKRKTNLLQKIFMCSAIGVITVMGYYLRPIVVIPTLAFVIYKFINQKNIWTSIKKYYSVAFIAIIVSAISFFSIKSMNNYYAPPSDKTMPMTHWVMMGLHGNGTVTPEDIYFTLSYKNTDDMKKANIQEIKRTMSEYNPLSFTQHLLSKLQVNWSEGTGNASTYYDGDQKASFIGSYIMGQNNELFNLYCQAYRLTIMLLALLGIFSLTRTHQKTMWFLSLTLFGGILFYLIWEAKSIYCVPFLPIVIVIASDALEGISSVKPVKKVFPSVAILLLAVTFGLGIAGYSALTKETRNYKDYTIKSDINNFYLYIDSVSTLSQDNYQIQQDFYAAKPFSKIEINAFVKDETANCKYQINLYNQSGKLINEKYVTYKDVYKGIITMRVPLQNVTHKTKYTLTILPVKDKQKDSIRWVWKYSKASDQFPGQAYLKSVSSNATIGDLNLRVYKEYDKPYMVWWHYLVLYTSVLLIEVYMLFTLYKKRL